MNRNANWTMVLVMVAVLGLAGMAQAAEVLHWTLDETSGSTFKEEVSGLTNVATKQGNVLMGQMAVAGDGGFSIGVGNDTPASFVDAGTLRSDNTYVPGSDASYKTISNQWTITSWVNTDTTSGGDKIIISSDWNSGDGWMIGLTSGSNVFMDFGNERRASGLNLAAGTDYFVALVNDTNNVGSGDDARFYVYDGSTWLTADVSHNRPTRRLQGLEIGSFNSGTRQFDGLLDDVRIFDHALTQAELDELANPTTGPEVPEPATMALLGLAACGLGGYVRRRRRA